MYAYRDDMRKRRDMDLLQLFRSGPIFYAGQDVCPLCYVSEPRDR